MPKTSIIYHADQDIRGKHLRSKLWVLYTGKLTVYERKSNPVVLKLKSDIYDSFMREFMDEKKEFKGESVSEVYGKLAKWFYKSGIIFQH